jgi:Ca-activated chloride channel family protein
MVEFMHPFIFIFLLAPLFIYFSSLKYISNRAALRISFMEDIRSIEGRKEQSAGVSRATFFQKLMLLAVWILVVLALAKPQLIGKPIIKEISQREILVAVDLSGSMSTQDFKGKDGKKIDRLEAVKYVLTNFFEKRKGEKIGLILFGSAAFVQSPFTQDLTALNHLLSEVQVGMAGPQTMIGDGIGLGVKMFQESNVTDRMLILMSDGDDTGSKVPPKTAAKLAAQNDVKIFTIAMGDPKNAGEHPIDTDTLKTIASETKGKFYYAWNSAELLEIYDEIDKLTPKKVKELSYRPVTELYIYPLALALLLMLLYTLVLIGKKRSTKEAWEGQHE